MTKNYKHRTSLKYVHSILAIGLIIGTAVFAKPVIATECDFEAMRAEVEADVASFIRGTEFADWQYTIQPDTLSPCASGGRPRILFVVDLPLDSNLSITYQQTFGHYIVGPTTPADFVSSLRDINFVDAQLLVDKAEAKSAITAYVDSFEFVQAEMDVTWYKSIYTYPHEYAYKDNPPAEDAFEGKITYQQVTTIKKDKYPLLFYIESRTDPGTIRRFTTYPAALEQTGLFGLDPMRQAMNVAFETTQKEETLLAVWRQSIRWAIGIVMIGVIGTLILIILLIVLILRNKQKKNSK